MLDESFTAPADYDDFAFGSCAESGAGSCLRVSIFADRGVLREEMRDDALAAGLRVGEVMPLAHLLNEDGVALGDVVLVDCPQADGEALASLARLDLRAKRSAAALVVSTTVDALEDVFGCLDQSDPQILVAPSRAERVVALGLVLARMPARRVRELSEADRMVLLRLTQQVAEIGEKLSVLSPSTVAPSKAQSADAGAAFRFEEAREQGGSDRLVQSGKAGMPDPRMIRRIIRQRQMRARFFDGDLFADPAWDMLLDLTAAQAEHAKVSVTSLCIASGVPPTTALRWIGQMTEAGLLQRMEDETDRRRAFIALTAKAEDAMRAYFDEMGSSVNRLV